MYFNDTVSASTLYFHFKKKYKEKKEKVEEANNQIITAMANLIKAEII